MMTLLNLCGVGCIVGVLGCLGIAALLCRHAAHGYLKLALMGMCIAGAGAQGLRAYVLLFDGSSESLGVLIAVVSCLFGMSCGVAFLCMVGFLKAKG